MSDIRCTGEYRGKPCNRYLGRAENLRGTFITKCEKCNGHVKIVDGQIKLVRYLVNQP